MENMRKINILKMTIFTAAVFGLGVFWNAGEVQAERFFQQHSTWYELIPDPAPVKSNSANYINYYDAGCFWLDKDGNEDPHWANPNPTGPCTKEGQPNGGRIGQFWDISHRTEWGKPIVVASYGTPPVNVNKNLYTGYDFQWVKTDALNVNDAVPIPVGTKSAGMDTYCKRMPNNSCSDNPSGYCNRDAPLIIIEQDSSGRYIYSYEQPKSKICDSQGGHTQPNEGIMGWISAYVKKWDLSGTGVFEYYDPMGSYTGGLNINDPNWDEAAIISQSNLEHYGIRQMKGSALHGNVTYKEAFVDGAIDHAVAVVIGATKYAWHVYPSLGGFGGVTTEPWSFPVGSRVQLKTKAQDSTNGVDCGSYADFNIGEQALCVALQAYGAIITDTNSGQTSIETENMINQPENTMDFSDFNKEFRWRNFQVIDETEMMPPFFNPADVNEDTKVNIKDIQACIKVIINSQTDQNIIAKCRVLADPPGTTNIKDIQVIIRKIINP